MSFAHYAESYPAYASESALSTLQKELGESDTVMQPSPQIPH